MTPTDTVVVGAGHAGLAVSRLLTEAARDHVVLERGRVAERWHSQRWDSLRLLTPNWMTRLPGWSYCRRRPGRLPDRCRVRDVPAQLRTWLRRAGARPHRRDRDPTARRRVHGDDDVGDLAGAQRRARHRLLRHRPHTTGPGPARPRRPRGQLRRLPQPGAAAPGRRPRRGGVRVRGADRRRTGAQRPAGRARRRRPHPGAAPLPRPGRDGLARPARAARPPGRRGHRPRPSAARALAAARRTSRWRHPRPRLAAAVGRAARRAAGRDGRQHGPLRRRPGPHDRGRRRAAAPPACPHRHPHQHVRTGRGAPARRTPAGGPPGAGSGRARPGRRRHRLRRHRDRLPARLPLAASARPRRRRRDRQRGGRTPVPGLYVVGMRFQTRRNSTFIGGARHDAALVVDAIAARGGATATSTLRRAG